MVNPFKAVGNTAKGMFDAANGCCPGLLFFLFFMGSMSGAVLSRGSLPSSQAKMVGSSRYACWVRTLTCETRWAIQSL